MSPLSSSVIVKKEKAVTSGGKKSSNIQQLLELLLKIHPLPQAGMGSGSAQLTVKEGKFPLGFSILRISSTH